MGERTREKKSTMRRLRSAGGWIGLFYTFGVEFARMESWDALAEAIVRHIQDAQKLFEFMGRVVAVLAMPLDIFTEILFWFVPIEIPPEMRVPVMAGTILAGVVIAAIGVSTVPASRSLQRSIFGMPQAALVFPLSPEDNEVIAQHALGVLRRGATRMFMLGPLTDYLRGLQHGLPRHHLLSRFNRAAADLEQICALSIFGGEGANEAAMARLRTRRRRLEAAAVIFGVILLDMAWHDPAGTVPLTLWRIAQVAMWIVVALLGLALLIMLVPMVVMVSKRLLLGDRARKNKHAGDRSGSGPMAQFIVPRLFHWLARMFEEGRDPEMFDLGEIKVEFSPEGSAKSDRTAELMVRHSRDVSYAAIAGVRLKSWPSRIEIISLGGHVFPRPAGLKRGWRRARSVHMVFEECGEVLDQHVYPVLRWWQGPASALKGVVQGAQGDKPPSASATEVSRSRQH